MSIYLLLNPPRRSQFRRVRRQRPSGVTVLHSAENMLDLMGEDSGAESVARFIRDRTEPGSYHDLVDSDSALQLVSYDAEAYQDGTGSNPHALSISWAIRATDWPNLSPQRTADLLEQGAHAFARQQSWLKANGHPTTPLRRISRMQSTQGVPGFVTHADRDSARRSDPGGRPDRFPWDSWFAACRAALAPPTLEDDIVTPEDIERIAQRTRQVIADGQLRYGLDNLYRMLTILLANSVTRVQLDAALEGLPAEVVDEIRNRLSKGTS